VRLMACWGVHVDGSRLSETREWPELSAVERYESSIGGTVRETFSGSSELRLAPLRKRILITDVLVIVACLGIGLAMSARVSSWDINPLFAIYGSPIAIGILWFGFLVFRGAYDHRILGIGTEEVRRVGSATLLTFSLVAGVSYLFRADISRAYAFISLPIGFLAIVGFRFMWRSWLYRERAKGRMMMRTIVIGNDSRAQEMTVRFAEDRFAGYEVVAQLELVRNQKDQNDSWFDELDRLMAEFGVDAVAVTPSEELQGEFVRQLSWRLEGRRIDLLIAPALADLSGPRVSMRPAAGLPLLHLDEAVLSRPQAFAKRGLDLAGAFILIVLFLPIFLVCALAVRVTSAGPIIFRQTRIGLRGHPFTMLKFRTMNVQAEAQLDGLRNEHELTDPMFKLVEDPRITRVGKFLRRWSLDEIPQFFNVLSGSMSLVGPRPHPLDDVSRYELEAYRRLALKPGLTGLWQVEGRSNLTWSEALQLDLYYIETWSLSGDAVLLFRTARAVLIGRGAH
jgi:exopolysaccharide biosynthesis polyprenyl glycosylphosphotransferase